VAAHQSSPCWALWLIGGSRGAGAGHDGPCGGRLVASGARNRLGDGERRWWPETRGEAKLGAQTRGFGAENEYGENGGARAQFIGAK
jgi:hypothetical protein